MLAILTDVTKCIGCERCVQACRLANELPPSIPFRWSHQKDGLAANRWCSIQRKEDHFVRKMCMHCIDPACASACPVAALWKTPEGPVIYDQDKCLGCRYCMMSCPFGIPRYDWENSVPFVRKCQMCYLNRTSKGELPACVEACPVQATIFGERDELLAEAHKRIKENPDKYMPHVFGENEVGGTSVLVLAPFDLDFLALGNKLDERTLPSRTAPAMSAVPPVFLGMATLMGSVYWVIERRMRLQKGKTGETSGHSTSENAPTAETSTREEDNVQ